MQKLWCSKLLKYFNKKGQIIRPFLLLLVPYIRFLFESLKLIKQFSSRFYQISAWSNVLKYFNIFQKVLPSSNFFLSRHCFLFFYLAPKWRVGNYFLYKAPVYLPIENIKPFSQNGWSIRTWESWLLQLVKNQMWKKNFFRYNSNRLLATVLTWLIIKIKGYHISVTFTFSIGKHSYESTLRQFLVKIKPKIKHLTSSWNCSSPFSPSTRYEKKMFNNQFRKMSNRLTTTLLN